MYNSIIADQIVFVKPEYVPDMGTKNPLGHDQELFKSISLAAMEAKEQTWFIRMLRSIKSFNRSYSNEPNIHVLERLLLLVTSFEILFEGKTTSGSKLGKVMASLIAPSPSEFPDDSKLVESLVNRLYKMRSRYTHGNPIDKIQIIDPEFGDMFRVGCYVYGLAIKNLLSCQGYLSNHDDYTKHIDLWRLLRIMKEPEQEL